MEASFQRAVQGVSEWSGVSGNISIGRQGSLVLLHLFCTPMNIYAHGSCKNFSLLIFLCYINSLTLCRRKYFSLASNLYIDSHDLLQTVKKRSIDSAKHVSIMSEMVIDKQEDRQVG